MTNLCNSKTQNLLPIEQANAKIRNQLQAITGNEKLSLNTALGRTLQKSVLARYNYPFNDVSSMDGYALNTQGINPIQPFQLTCCGTSWAGKPYPKTLSPNQCIRIFTGAVLPQGADSIIIQELVSVQETTITFPANPTLYDNIRFSGEDYKKGDLLLPVHKKLTAVDLSFLASAGIYEVSVYRQVNIAFFSTGDELTTVGQPLGSGKVFDSNRHALNGLLDDPCYNCTDLGRYADHYELLKKTLQDAANQYDVLITTGGASVGDADFIKDIMNEIGQIDFWKIAMKPGKPLAFGHINSTLFFGLPGNPVSVIATFQQIVEPALKQLAGLSPTKRLQLKAQCLTALKKTPGRKDFQRGILKQNDNGDLTVISSGQQGSHILSSISAANCYIILEAQCHSLPAGQWVTVEPFSCFIAE
ncbi:MAG TPA: molybdopterin molybdotransferase MoeA [Methylococcaceae bacterium]|jgi:molybdopterin molybdotransferase|nr:molybdopterin molybdotransferase MoeA [Methylococcaceae bacterium]HIN68572.1 molybdopterin molybdenumtransferase MoeA [Methylococcales bacterium]HIA45746.1 molybdopterin molybdotransferase MoeA [Methylococcaceae bacterium]HIB62853.1 molybdopterin molybdotransferase MoeA [Methylococcaceae bacterium]HIO12211.1 molybdopterin molybdenumtransferase MoeA [Methylococcales bacterium]